MEEVLQEILAMIAGGLFAGLVGALMGVGGGIVVVPFVNVVMGFPMHNAAAAGLVSTLSVSCAAAGRYLVKESSLIDISLAMQVALFSCCGGFFGGIAAGWFDGWVLQLIFACVLAYAAVYTFSDSGKQGKPCNNGELQAWPGLLGFFVVFLAGALAGLLGIGGGIIVVPVLHIIFKQTFKVSLASSNYIMGLTALPALSGYVARLQLDLVVAVPVAFGVLLGATIGSQIMPRLRSKVLKILFAGLLVVTAFEMARQGIRGL